jgi:hypothetical protein
MLWELGRKQQTQPAERNSVTDVVTGVVEEKDENAKKVLMVVARRMWSR